MTLDDLHLEPFHNDGNDGDPLQGMDPPTYEEAILLATDCLSIACSDPTSLSPDGSQPSLSQSPPKNLEHFSPKTPMGSSPYPSPGHPAPHMSPSGLPTPDPSPVGHGNPSTARVNISWQGMGQMKVSTQPQQHCQPTPPPPQMQSKSALISTTIKKKERQDMYGPSCITGQPMVVSPRGMQQGVQGNWMHQNQVQVPRNMQQQQYNWKTAQQAMQQSPIQNFAGQRTAAAMGSENAVYATNMQGGKWDLNVPPLFEDTLPSLEYEGGLGYMKTAQQNIGGTHLQHHGWEPPVDILSPPYQEDFHSGFGFQGNPLPANSQGQTTLGWG